MDKDTSLDKLATPEIREVFRRYTISVGSTGNLGISIGLSATALGFKSVVHMSHNAKDWKKELLRSHGVKVVEHSSDYSEAVLKGRLEAEKDPLTYFVDDENSKRLFLGYATAGLRLKKQFDDQKIRIDEENPLFVYLPCGVGGAPGGISFGLKQVYGNAVHTFFAEPTGAASMSLALTDRLNPPKSIKKAGLPLKTEADGLACGKASDLVVEMMGNLISGTFTVSDEKMPNFVKRLFEAEGLKVEPSGTPGYAGPDYLLNTNHGLEYIKKACKDQDRILHLIWTTGGSLMPDREFEKMIRGSLKN